MREQGRPLCEGRKPNGKPVKDENGNIIREVFLKGERI